MRALIGAIFVAQLFAMPAAARADAPDLKRLGAFPIDSIAVQKGESKGKFTVIDSRMTDDAGVETVFFGMIGAAVSAGVSADKDAEKAKPYRERADTLNLIPILRKNLEETLSSKGFALADDPKAASHVVDVELLEWGLIRTSVRSPEMAAFLVAHVTMKGGRKLVWDTRVKEAGKIEKTLTEYGAETLASEMEAVAANTGKRIAYEIIYR